MSERLPLEVLSFVAPILSWVEGTEGHRLPLTWQRGGLRVSELEEAWLLREIPTYSRDNVAEIAQVREGEGRGSPSRQRLRRRGSREPVAPPDGYDLGQVFHRLSERYFEWSAGELMIKSGRLEELHEVGLRFPVRHLIRSCHARAVAAGFLSPEAALEMSEIKSVLKAGNRGLRVVVERGLSEVHLHLWGVGTPDEAWANHLLAPLSADALTSFSSAERRLLILSRTAVRLLALGVLTSLSRDPSLRPPVHLIPYLDILYQARNRVEERRAWRSLVRAFRDYIRGTRQGDEDRRCHSWQERHQPEVNRLLTLIDAPLAWAWRRKVPSRKRPSAPRGVGDHIQLLDWLHFNVQCLLLELPREDRIGSESHGDHDADSAAERVRTSTPQERASANLRQYLHQTFFRYLVYHTHHWQQATQSGRTTGLRQFHLHYRARQRRTFSHDWVEEHGRVLARLSRGSPLNVVEGRVGPPQRGPQELLPWVLGYARGLERGEVQKLGLVIHFYKASAEQVEAERKSLERGYPVLRLGEVRRRTRRTAFRLFSMLSEPHPVTPFIVGIDAANLELTTPPEVFAPAFRFLRAHPIEVKQRSSFRSRIERHRQIAALLKGRHLGMTYHVGEEFRHLLSGLRAIDEVIEFLAPRPGDRLGHATALALDPDVWASQIGYQAVLPQQEWLDTLVWAHHLLGPGNDLIGELAVEDEIQRLSRKVYAPAQRHTKLRLELQPPTLYDAWRLRQLDPYSLQIDPKTGDPQVDPVLGQIEVSRRWNDIQGEVLRKVDAHVGSSQAYRLLHHYWFHPGVRKEGDRIIAVDLETSWRCWRQICREVQAKVQSKVQNRQLVIEVNPTCNRVVGAMARLAHHHVFPLTLDSEQNLSRKIRVTINTDDPGVFNTSLSHEFYLLGELRLAQGVPEAQVAEWLEWLRANGVDYSFLSTLADPDDDPAVREFLEHLVRTNRRLLHRLGGRHSDAIRWLAENVRGRSALHTRGQLRVPLERCDGD